MDRQEYINNMLKPCSEETNEYILSTFTYYDDVLTGGYRFEMHDGNYKAYQIVSFSEYQDLIKSIGQDETECMMKNILFDKIKIEKKESKESKDKSINMPVLGINKTLVLGVDIAANGDDAVISVMENTGSSIKYINSFTGEDAKILYDILYNKDFESLKQLLKKSVDLDDEEEFEFFKKTDYETGYEKFSLKKNNHMVTENIPFFEYNDLVKRVGRTRVNNIIKLKLIEKIKSEKETTLKQDQQKLTFSDLKSKYSAEVYISDSPYGFGKRVLISVGDTKWRRNIYNDEISKDNEDIVCREFIAYYKKKN